MTPQGRTELAANLEESLREFHSTLEGLKEAEARACPSPGRWSVLECIEHLTVVEERFRGILKNAERVGAPSMDKERETALVDRVAGRRERAQAPDPVQPSGRFASVAQALEAFNAARAETVRFVEAHYGELYSIAASHPRFGPLNGYEYVLILAAHTRRHAAQVRETRATLAGA